jgi:hypothetical protein
MHELFRDDTCFKSVYLKILLASPAWWYISIVPALEKLRQKDCLTLGVQDQLEQHKGKTLISTNK